MKTGVLICRVWLLVIALVLADEAHGQRVMLGRDAADRVLPGFWSQQSNASNTILGLNLNATGIELTNRLLPELISAKRLTNGVLDGTAVLTNSAVLLIRSNASLVFWTNSFLSFSNGTWIQDGTAGRKWNFQLAPDSNTVARFADVTNTVTGMKESAGWWVPLSAFALTQFGTNAVQIALKPGATLTNTEVKERLVISGGAVWNSVSKTTNYTAATNDVYIFADATASNLLITLPTVAVGRHSFTVKKVDASGNSVSVRTTGGEFVDGSTNYSLATQHKFVSVVSDLSQWRVVGAN